MQKWNEEKWLYCARNRDQYPSKHLHLYCTAGNAGSLNEEATAFKAAYDQEAAAHGALQRQFAALQAQHTAALAELAASTAALQSTTESNSSLQVS